MEIYLDKLPRELIKQICTFVDVETIYNIDVIYPEIFEDEYFWTKYFEINNIDKRKRPSIKDYNIMCYNLLKLNIPKRNDRKKCIDYTDDEIFIPLMILDKLNSIGNFKPGLLSQKLQMINDIRGDLKYDLKIFNIKFEGTVTSNDTVASNDTVTSNGTVTFDVGVRAFFEPRIDSWCHHKNQYFNDKEYSKYLRVLEYFKVDPGHIKYGESLGPNYQSVTMKQSAKIIFDTIVLTKEQFKEFDKDLVFCYGIHYW